MGHTVLQVPQFRLSFLMFLQTPPQQYWSPVHGAPAQQCGHRAVSKKREGTSKQATSCQWHHHLPVPHLHSQFTQVLPLVHSRPSAPHWMLVAANSHERSAQGGQRAEGAGRDNVLLGRSVLAPRQAHSSQS